MNTSYKGKKKKIKENNSWKLNSNYKRWMLAGKLSKTINLHC
jgi:hypothetical protein